MHKSEFADDPDMKELVEEYIGRLPGEVAKLHALLESGDIENLRRVAHQLKGSGGGYGFAGITEKAAVVDASIKQNVDLDRVRGQIDELVGYLREISGYNASLEKVNAPECAAH